MLVLTRKKNDSIVIDGRILVEVLQIRGSGIRLGISAPPEVSILRGELKPFGVEPGHSQGATEFAASLPTRRVDLNAGSPESHEPPAWELS